MPRTKTSRKKQTDIRSMVIVALASLALAIILIYVFMSTNARTTDLGAQITGTTTTVAPVQKSTPLRVDTNRTTANPFRAEGIAAGLGVYTITFTVLPGQTMYISRVPDQGLAYEFTNSFGVPVPHGTAGGTAAFDIVSGATTTASGEIKINANQPAVLRLAGFFAVPQAAPAGDYNMRINGVWWSSQPGATKTLYRFPTSIATSYIKVKDIQVTPTP